MKTLIQKTLPTSHFYWRCCENLDVIKELAGICCMTGHTTSKKSPVKWESLWIKWEFDFTNFVAICTVGALAMYRKNIVAVDLHEEFIRRQISKLLQVLCSRIWKFEHAMSVVVSSLNYLFPRVISWRGGCQVQRLNLSHVWGGWIEEEFFSILLLWNMR